MFGVLVILGMVPVLIGAGAFLLGAGLRPAAAGDAGVTAAACVIAQPDGSWPAVLATVRNPGAAPVLVGLCVRRRRLRVGGRGDECGRALADDPAAVPRGPAGGVGRGRGRGYRPVDRAVAA